MNTDSDIQYPFIDQDVSEYMRIALEAPGVAGSVRLRLDCGLVIAVDIWEPSRLLEIIINPEFSDPWDEDIRNAVFELTGIRASGALNFLMASKQGVTPLPVSVQQMAITQNMTLQISPIYGLDLVASPTRLSLFSEAKVSVTDRAFRSFSKLAKSIDDETLNSFTLELRSLVDGRQPDPSTPIQRLLKSIADSGPVKSKITTPMYPVPALDRRPEAPEHSTMLRDYDIDHDLVDAAWCTNFDGIGTAQFTALSQFEDIDIYAEARDLLADNNPTTRVRLLYTGKKRDGLNLFEAAWTDGISDLDVVTIYSSPQGESSPRKVRATRVAQNLMASVMARYHCNHSFCDPSESWNIDPTLVIAIGQASDIYSKIVGSQSMAKLCTSKDIVIEETSIVSAVAFLLRESFNPNPDIVLLSERTEWERVQNEAALLKELKDLIENLSGSSRKQVEFGGMRSSTSTRSFSLPNFVSFSRSNVANDWVNRIADVPEAIDWNVIADQLRRRLRRPE